VGLTRAKLSHADMCLASSLCTWNIIVLLDKITLIHFTKLDVESQVGCDRDYVSICLSRRELISLSGCLGVGVTGSNFLSFVVMKNSKSSWLLRSLLYFAL